MADSTEGIGGLKYDKTKRAWPNELNIFFALIAIVLIFEALGQILPYMNGQSMLFDFNTKRDGTILNIARLKIIILQVSIIGIIALGVTQVIISGGIDLSSGPLVGAAAMIVMSFAQTELVNGNPNPKAVFGDWAFDLPVIVPVIVGLSFGAFIGAINGSLIAYTRIPPFIATLGMFLICRGIAQWWTRGQPVSFPTEGYAWLGSGMMPVVWFLMLAVLFHFVLRHTVYGKHTYAIGSNEDAARMSGINVQRHKILVYMIASMLAAFAAIVLSSKNLTAQTGMGQFYELFAIAMAVIGGVSLTGGRGSVVGTVLGAMVFGVIQSGFTYIRLDAFYQLMAMGTIIISAVVLDQWRQKTGKSRS
ncbi:monosaccharide ABC transporter membrane protein, CUT2 family [Ruegeria halocynthiae]|uniref:Monosaccharide ABC transporter membrane protein, CUT2 family n=1 Tax=Ruegeria halocynthiae TaxID=985054 RepID=A0A1H3F5V2_9RHOB|nr:ABC transporter permease [Ruegeria halocynthiae]SDX85728.1 monosaccharide ABC transporter membrane protein, CUT2 family [Ruegeria halocynthiae]